MTGFTAAWLERRAAVDDRSRSPRIAALIAAWAQGQDTGVGAPLAIVDLGAGSGNNMVALAPRLRPGQRWLLVDDDEALLALARERAAILEGHQVTIETSMADLNKTDLVRLTQGARLVAASALFDLVSETWCQRLIGAVSAPGRALLALLTYDGRIAFSPAAEDDDLVRSLVNRHQRTNKVFGPALGPDAVACLGRLARQSGARVIVDRSDWVLGPGDGDLVQDLLAGWAEAALELSPNHGDRIRRWCDRRQGGLSAPFRITVGHQDLLALW
jgi:hypothetical protein